MEPVIKEIQKTYGGKINIKTIDLSVQNEENFKAAMKYRVQYVPTFVFLDASGKIIGPKNAPVVGELKKEEIIKIFSDIGVK